MRDWEQYVRNRLSSIALSLDRDSRIVRELASQLEDFYRDATARGMTEADADAYARAQITDWTRLAESLRNADQQHLKITTRKQMSDLKYSTKIFRRRPAFVVLIIAVLGLGLAANATMFTVVNGLLLRPLPYAAADRLIEISQIPRNVSIADLEQAASVEQIAGFTIVNQPVGEDATPVLGMRASGNLFKVLGVNAFLGRVFAPDTDEARELYE